MLDQLDRYHGQATGIFTCDEHLAGRSPSQGTELCTVVEAMYSLELLDGHPGRRPAGRPAGEARLQRPAGDVQEGHDGPPVRPAVQPGVCKVSEREHVYTSNGADANLYGLEPNFGCCTANMHQGWPKFVSHLWMKTPDGGLAVVAYAPCVVETKIQGKPVKVEVKTEYPFRDDITIEVTVAEPMTFSLDLRGTRLGEEAGDPAVDAGCRDRRGERARRLDRARSRSEGASAGRGLPAPESPMERDPVGGPPLRRRTRGSTGAATMRSPSSAARWSSPCRSRPSGRRSRTTRSSPTGRSTRNRPGTTRSSSTASTPSDRSGSWIAPRERSPSRRRGPGWSPR